MYVDPYGDINDAGHKVGDGSSVVCCSVLVLLCFALLCCFCLVELRLFLGLELLRVWHDREIFGTYCCLLLLRAILPAHGGLRAQFCYLFCFALLSLLSYLPCSWRALGHSCRLRIGEWRPRPEGQDLGSRLYLRRTREPSDILWRFFWLSLSAM
jgi:hypothetical protein